MIFVDQNWVILFGHFFMKSNLQYVWGYSWKFQHFLVPASIFTKDFLKAGSTKFSCFWCAYVLSGRKIRSPGLQLIPCKIGCRQKKVLKFSVMASNILQIRFNKELNKNYHPILICKNQFLILLVIYVVSCCILFPHHCMLLQYSI